MSLRDSKIVRNQKSKIKTTPLGLEQLEQRMMCAVDAIQGNLNLLSQPAVGNSQPNAWVGNSAPTIVNSVSSGLQSSQLTAKSTSLSILGSDDGGEANLVYTWSIVAAPTGGTVSFSTNARNSAKQTVATFSKVGEYTVKATIVDRSGLSTSETIRLTVVPSFASVGLATQDNRVVALGGSVTTNGVSQQLVASALDQFGQRLNSQPTFEWSTLTAPANSNPTIITDQGIATYTFNRAGTYTVKAVSGSIVRTAQINVQQTLTSGKISSDNTLVSNGQTLSVSTSTQRITAEGFDQFGNKLSAVPTWTWSATSTTSGAIATFATANGVTTITFNRAATYAITARSGSIVLNFNTAVSQTFTNIGVYTPQALTGSGLSSLNVTTTNQNLVAQGLDQFGQRLSSQPTFEWSTVSAPANSNPTITTDQGIATYTFNRAGTYTVQSSLWFDRSNSTDQCPADAHQRKDFFGW